MISTKVNPPVALTWRKGLENSTDWFIVSPLIVLKLRMFQVLRSTTNLNRNANWFARQIRPHEIDLKMQLDASRYGTMSKHEDDTRALIDQNVSLALE